MKLLWFDPNTLMFAGKLPKAVCKVAGGCYSLRLEGLTSRPRAHCSCVPLLLDGLLVTLHPINMYCLNLPRTVALFCPLFWFWFVISDTACFLDFLHVLT